MKYKTTHKSQREPAQVDIPNPKLKINRDKPVLRKNMQAFEWGTEEDHGNSRSL
jgi:hypothetical protein